MRALSFEHYGRQTYGIRDASGVREASAVFRQQFPDLRAVIAAGMLERLPSNCIRDALAEEAVTFLPTIPRPSRIICVGVNYRPHVEEMGREIPEKPVLFVRFPGSLVGHGQPLVRPRASGQFDFEGELAIVIGRRARHVAPADAARYIAGYTGFMDGSVRDWQRHTPQFTPGKNFDMSGAMGPYLVTPDEAGPLAELPIETRVNGEVMQQA
ncbi:MAG: fumarylacetoacetate hydrolase family protein, partial [Woeseiaceae bacterium]|nr:fumarylacetoacetate hydrolase family protein [Woeseiaceae bacterium]